MRTAARRILRPGLPGALLFLILRPRTSPRARILAAAGLVSIWSAVYYRYRARWRDQTAKEYRLLETASFESFKRHYNERVPTIEEEFDIWGEYHQHRHEMRYDLVAAEARRHLPRAGLLLDIGCGAALVAERLADVPARYVGTDFGGHHIHYAAKRMAELEGAAIG